MTKREELAQLLYEMAYEGMSGQHRCKAADKIAALLIPEEPGGVVYHSLPECPDRCRNGWHVYGCRCSCHVKTATDSRFWSVACRGGQCGGCLMEGCPHPCHAKPTPPKPEPENDWKFDWLEGGEFARAIREYRRDSVPGVVTGAFPRLIDAIRANFRADRDQLKASLQKLADSRDALFAENKRFREALERILRKSDSLYARDEAMAALKGDSK